MQNSANKFQKAAQDLTRLVRTFPRRAGNEAKNYFNESFRSESWEGGQWEARKYPDKNKRKRNLLVKTGRLKRSIRVTQSGVGFVQVSSDVPYAQIHNEGGIIDAVQSVRSHRRKVASRNTFEGKQRTSSGMVIVKQHSRKVNISMPRRQFMGSSARLEKRLRYQLESEYDVIMESIFSD